MGNNISSNNLEKSTTSFDNQSIANHAVDKQPSFSSTQSDTIVNIQPSTSETRDSIGPLDSNFKSRSVHRSIRERYNSTISASGFSINPDPFHFSAVADSNITDITNVSGFSFNSFLDKISDDNHYIMHSPDLDYHATVALPSIDSLSTTNEILNMLENYPQLTYDLLTSLYGSIRMKNDLDLQREAFHAAETWSLRPTDTIAKTIVACCTLCGWGTPKHARRGFQSLLALAKRGVWESYYYLAQCYEKGVEQASEGLNLSGRPLSVHLIQPIDQAQAIYWYQQLIQSDTNIQSARLSYYVAEAQFRMAAMNFTLDKISPENADENLNYLKQSVVAGNRKAEFSLGLLIETGYIQDEKPAEEYYRRSARKNFSPAQIQLAFILLKNNPSESIDWLKRAAQLGDPRAIHYLGESYEFGRGHNRRDSDLAVHYYQLAADQYNHAMSELRLGMHYFHGGLNLPKDYNKAFSYLERASERGMADAQYLLGMMYRKNLIPNSHQISLQKRREEAFRWIRKAADQRLHAAISQLATCYEEGVGVLPNPSIALKLHEVACQMPGKHLSSARQSYACYLHKIGDYPKALALYRLAAGLDHSPITTHPSLPSVVRVAKRMVALFYLDRKDKTTPYDPHLALDLLRSLTLSQEDPEAEYWLAVCYEEGVPGVIEVDLEQAYSHYVISAHLGSSDSQFQVGHMLCKGLGVAKDRLEAFEWFKKAAEKNNAKALYYIGIYYYNGSGSITRDHEQARTYFKRAAELKHTDAMVSYAQVCQEKAKTETSKTEKENYQNEAFKWYTKAAKLNHLTALRELGRLYGTKGDFKKSAECYVKASTLNDALSTLFLGGYYEKGQGVTQNKQIALAHYKKAIELGHPTALFAIAELYENLKEYEKSYAYYKRVSEDSRISKTYKSSKTSRLKVALYSLNYDSNTFIYDQIPLKNTKPFDTFQRLPKTEAFDILMRLAKEDKWTDAFNWIAECYQDGEGVPQSYSESLHWRIKASEAGDLNATMRLAYMYENGLNGVQKNPSTSHQLYQMCADKHNVLSQHKLGMIYWRGQDTIPINLGTAVVWFTKSARQGYAASHWALGQIALENGDLHIAMAWWETAIRFTKNEDQSFHSINLVQLLKTSTGASDALLFLGKYIQEQQDPVLESAMCETAFSSSSSSSSVSSIRDEAEYMSRAQQENHGLALRCFSQAALMGNVEGMYLTAEAWHKAKDYPIALEHYEKAAANGHVPSRIMCATYQIYGLGGKKINATQGFQELVECAATDPEACVHLARCFECGLGTEQDIVKALEWYQHSIEKCHSAEAMFRVAQIYAQKELTEMIEQITGDTIDGEREAIHWYERAIEGGHVRANFRLALYYLHGFEPNPTHQADRDQAIKYLRVAARLNDQDAMFSLGQLLLSTQPDFPLELQEEGLSWLEIAADHDYRDAQRELGNLYHNGRDGLLTIPQDFDKAFDYFSMAAHRGDKTSALFLGTYYEHGIRLAPNIEMAQQWYTMAIGIEHEDESENERPLHDPSGWWPAQLCLARVLHQIPEAQPKAYKLFLTVYAHRPEQHMAYLEFMISLYELKGYIGDVSVSQVERAAANLLVLAKQGYLKAFVPVAECYEIGHGVPKDLAKALHFYVLLVHHPVVDQDGLDEDDLRDLAFAYYRLGDFYRRGVIVAIDLEKSDTLYRIAAEKGSKEAKEYLESIQSFEVYDDIIDP